MALKSEGRGRNFGISFEFFPPKSEEMEGQLWDTVSKLQDWDPDFVSVTYGAGGTTKAPTLSAVTRFLSQTPLATASHLTCVGATKEETHHMIDTFRKVGVKHFVALRGDAPGGVGAPYQPHPGGYANAAELVAGLKSVGDFEISVSAYPEKHPESRDTAADIDMLKRKADNGADRALTQFFFDNDNFERYLERVRAAGISIPIVPGIMPIQNLTQLKRFAGACGAVIPGFLDERFAGLDDKPEDRAKVAAEVAAEQIEDLVRRGIGDFHLYTMNRAPLVSAVLDNLGFARRTTKSAGAAA
ncbi:MULTISPECIES: methylenetetrahydrofolate reductase [NAD(P)H] [Rhizobium]|uniref:methylenetetrahydrofolate reductase [NAD(P)H] n=1 Tax=Rhizobium TaxID=379 RepID=UPI001B3332F5|nr:MULTISPECIES: methylenetetrahydrofolate reductase [NAD(P)H] [Rhizobium]MBX4905869.1 methylenetetrahydrofolate reductase [NAD(P)H] [Rhizobium bangladeshense]MBX5212723.1 methylenetetrahydrofolate reductase [NAD(P)H] [Rhizobium sp. NLR9a]MBX5220219.1 methylenetetrahydrofolate reductase [NAD(P)H] [Rhizobium sp. NLR8a]MBX5225371.1 methylenetetrahydrofolate reductase [NAD(P)H] [Rhizobium sp. NLR9b]MBX5231566.1 methylenetetrahydrofolate reductase [NAD(P)H] [Rhizobium sp. NLR4a]